MDEEQDDERSALKILGRTVGTFIGWNQGDTTSFVFYGFLSSLKSIKSGDLQVDYENGKLALYDDAGNETWEADIVEALMELPRE